MFSTVAQFYPIDDAAKVLISEQLCQTLDTQLENPIPWIRNHNQLWLRVPCNQIVESNEENCENSDGIWIGFDQLCHNKRRFITYNTKDKREIANWRSVVWPPNVNRKCVKTSVRVIKPCWLTINVGNSGLGNNTCFAKRSWPMGAINKYTFYPKGWHLSDGFITHMTTSSMKSFIVCVLTQ